jgi:hypothetical protein
MRRLADLSLPAILGFAMLTAACDRQQPRAHSPAADSVTTVDPEAHALGRALPPDTLVQQEVRVVLTEWGIKLSPDTIRAGPTRFRVINQGRETHEFEIEGPELGLPGDELKPGEETSLVLHLTPLTWEVHCPLATPSARGSHAKRGMHAQLVVR